MSDFDPNVAASIAAENTFQASQERPAANLHRGPHEVGKPCPEKPWMIVTTLDWQKSVCGACGRKLYATA